jgi:hypothetical protein
LAVPTRREKQALQMLDFVQREIHSSKEGVHVRVWKGPLDLLTDDETTDEE